jgi:hypothetical protein
VLLKSADGAVGTLHKTIRNRQESNGPHEKRFIPARF